MVSCPKIDFNSTGESEYFHVHILRRDDAFRINAAAASAYPRNEDLIRALQLSARRQSGQQGAGDTKKATPDGGKQGNLSIIN